MLHKCLILSDQLIELHKSMVETSADASAALGKATKEANAALMQLQDDFALAKRTIQDQILQEIESTSVKSRSTLERLLKSVDAMVQSTMNRLASRTKDADSSITTLTEACDMEIFKTYKPSADPF